MNHPDDIDILLSSVITLPSMPDAVTSVLSQLDDPLCSMAQVGQTLAGDPSLAMKALRLVNSAHYGLGQEVKTVEHAAALLGARAVRNLAMTATVFDTVGQETEMFLRHCVASGVAMRVLHKMTPLSATLESADEAFLLGLVHDIGKVIFSECVPDHIETVAQACVSERIPWYRAEQALIRVDHAAVGGRLAEHWKFAPEMAHAIAGHHQPDRVAAEHRVLAAYLCLADFLTNATGMVGIERAVYELPESVLVFTGLGVDTLVAATHAYFDALPAVRELQGLATAWA